MTDSLELAQFLYLLTNNEKLRHIIEAITSKVVLILGRFTGPHFEVLHSLRASLRHDGYLPVLFDFTKPSSRDLTETVVVLGHMARLVVADISSPRSVPHELASLVPQLLSVPVQPILMNGETPYGMFEHLQRYPHVLPVKHYTAPLDRDFVSGVIAASEDYHSRNIARR